MSALLLTGGTGSLGQSVIEAAATRALPLRVLSRRPPPPRGSSSIAWIAGDVVTGDGLARALDGVDVVIHAASDPRRAQAVDVEGTRRLTRAAREAGVRHFIYVSIVGVDRIPYPYYRAKHAAEQIVEQSGVPWSLLRATQFHSLVDERLAGLARRPLVMPLPINLLVQSVAAEEVAGRLLRAVVEGPRGRLTDFGGPEVMTVGQAAALWRAVRRIRKPVLPLPAIGGVLSALRRGYNTAPGGDRGTVTWRAWLESRPASSSGGA